MYSINLDDCRNNLKNKDRKVGLYYSSGNKFFGLTSNAVEIKDR